jgi:hypothetical protein
LNPIRDTVTEYAPARTAGTVKTPRSLVTAVYVVPVAALCTETFAPGTTEGDESSTVPDNVVVAPCAAAGVLCAAITAIANPLTISLSTVHLIAALLTFEQASRRASRGRQWWDLE